MRRIQQAITLWLASVMLTLSLAVISAPQSAIEQPLLLAEQQVLLQSVLPDNPLPALLPENSFEPIEPVIPRTRTKLVTPRVSASVLPESEYKRTLLKNSVFPQALTRAPPAFA
ncbi:MULTISPECIES: hypothetical protein [Shewanella]|uniref:Uncharacterized protein n=1 Tax=Shewanella fodinae TaxID=552357 RepID=A0A4R2FG51_9GAMM|nr:MULTISPECIES: hypothetical protein [Shewanella]MBO1270878.1 hypothetical protein [Shewanella sp. 4t3-1-2LB]TCN88913.1 hypothetical protein EDC91_10394 [Shewanella fodinae]